MSATPTIYTVSGMTCEHCTRSVLEAVSTMCDVESAEIDLESGRLTIIGQASRDEIANAVHEAGYAVTP